MGPPTRKHPLPKNERELGLHIGYCLLYAIRAKSCLEFANGWLASLDGGASQDKGRGRAFQEKGRPSIEDGSARRQKEHLIVACSRKAGATEATLAKSSYFMGHNTKIEKSHNACETTIAQIRPCSRYCSPQPSPAVRAAVTSIGLREAMWMAP